MGNFIFALQTGSALMYDALKVFASSLRDFSENDDINVEELDCSSPSKWSQGEKILKILDEVISTKLYGFEFLI